MDYHGERFLTVSHFRSRARDLKIRSLNEDELEFYERQCLLLPVAKTITPAAHAQACAQEQMGVEVRTPSDLDPPADWRLLNDAPTGGDHPFDREMGRNPLLVKPECSTFEPWSANRVDVVLASGHTVKVPSVKRYYAYWQVHVVELLRSQGYYEHAPFLRELPDTSRLRKLYSIPADTGPVRTLRGLATGYEALTRFGVGYSSAVQEARAPFNGVGELPQAIQARLRETLRARATRTLGLIGVDEPSFFGFVIELLRLMENYRSEERAALADDVERDIGLAQQLAHYAFGYDWEKLVGALERHGGQHWSRALSRLDAVDAAAEEARKNLNYVTESGVGIPLDPSESDSLPQQVVDFCLSHELFEVLTGLGSYSFSDDDLHRDRFPGFLHRRLRPLALAVEQLTRGIVEEASKPHAGKRLPELLKTLGDSRPWISQFDAIKSEGNAADMAGDLDSWVAALAGSAQATDSEELVIARTFVLAVVARNLVSHRHRFSANETARTLAGACGRSIALVWILARRQGFI